MNKRPIIVLLDANTMNPGDLSWDQLKSLGELSVYGATLQSEVLTRSIRANILVANKVILDQNILASLPELQYVVVSATGYNNVDVTAAADLGIPVSNVRGYSSASVAQHVFAMLLNVIHQLGRYDYEVKSGVWSNQSDFSYWNEQITELDGLTFGIYGLGRIGSRVAKIANSFGMKVLAHHKHPERDAQPGVRFVSMDQLLKDSDVISLHAPLTTQNYQIIDRVALEKMRENAILINTARGDLINESDLYESLSNNRIRAATIDVLSVEPPPTNHLLFSLENCFISPHQAWATVASRQRLLEGVCDNISAFLKGKIINQVS